VARPLQAQLLKVWTSWEDGVGQAFDDGGETNGLLTATAILGLRNELRAAPKQNVTSVEPTNALTPNYFFEDIPTTFAASDAYLYALYSDADRFGSGAVEAATMKVDLRNATFGTEVEYSSAGTTNNEPFGQPAKYKGLWYLPIGGSGCTQLTVIAAAGGGDTHTALGVIGNANGGIDHLEMLNFKLAGVRRTKGAAILKLDGTVATDADWGTYFQVGDRDVRPLAIRGVQDLMFVLTEEGLFSFNDRGRSASVFTDFKHFRTNMREVAMTPWKSGLLIPTPGSLLYYAPGEDPIPIGFDDQASPIGSVTTDLGAGRWLGVVGSGEYIYGLYQTSLTGTTAKVMIGAPRRPNALHDIAWQCVGNTTLVDSVSLSGIFVSNMGFPESATVPSPSLWYNRGSATAANNLLEYVVLDPHGTPYRSRQETHVVTTSGSCYLPELIFPTPVELESIVVYAGGLASGDEWELKLIINGEATERELGTPVTGQGTSTVRAERGIHRKDVHRLVVKVTFTGTSAAARVAPYINRIELYGRSG